MVAGRMRGSFTFISTILLVRGFALTVAVRGSSTRMARGKR